MKVFISLDWDFFIADSSEFRNMYYPREGDESLTRDEQLALWKEHKKELRHSQIDERAKDGVYRIVANNVDRFEGFACADSHKYMYDFVKEGTAPDEVFMVINFDFHHDMYSYIRGDEVNCGNWVEKLNEIRPNMIYKWVGRKDSDRRVIWGDLDPDIFTTMEDVIRCDFRGSKMQLFICRSSMFSPPKHDNQYDSFKSTLHVALIDNNHIAQRFFYESTPIRYPTFCHKDNFPL